MIDINFVQFINSKDRKIVDNLLSKMKGYIDLVIPRGGKSLVKKVDDLSTVPYIGHLEEFVMHLLTKCKTWNGSKSFRI